MSQWTYLYNNTRWRKRRAHQLHIAPLCCICAQRGLAVRATVADHVVPHNGNLNAFWSGELQSLCAEHHRGTKKEQEYKGYCTDVGLDGWPLDPLHPVNNPMILLRPNKQTKQKGERIHPTDLIG
jgi:5-methylcytosine-specific restriction enzyme A